MVGYVWFIDIKYLLYFFNVLDFLEDLFIDGKIKELWWYNDVSLFELFVISCFFENGLEIFVGVLSECYFVYLESWFLFGKYCVKFNL